MISLMSYAKTVMIAKHVMLMSLSIATFAKKISHYKKSMTKNMVFAFLLTWISMT